MGKVKLSRVCPECKVSNEFVLPLANYQMWKSGTYIQDAFPELTAMEREGIQTGYHEECWEAIFGKEE